MDMKLHDQAKQMQWPDTDEEFMAIDEQFMAIDEQFMAILSRTLRWEVRPGPILILLKD